MARHHRMPSEEAGYTYAVEPAATNRLLANEEESIYGRSVGKFGQSTLTLLITSSGQANMLDSAVLFVIKLG